MKRVNNKQWIFWGWFVISSIAFSWLLLGPYGDHFRNLIIRLVLFSGMVAVGLVILRITTPIFRFWSSLLILMVGYAIIYEIATFLPGINNHPFTLTWSEGTAYYSASAYFSASLYGVQVPLPLINPTRHLLMAIPFLVEGLPIWVHRAWEVVLWLVLSFTAIYLFVRRLGIKNRLLHLAFLGWVFLYFFQGPVYYFLLISIIPVLWGFDARKPGRTLFLVLLGSAWAGASRVNWIPVPALLAATLFFLEVPLDGVSWRRYLVKPLIWFVTGVGVGLLVWFLYAQLSGQPVGNFGIYFTSNLLWYRLLPNATFRGGIFLMSMLASLPLIGIILIHLYRSGFNYHLVRHLGIALIVFVLYAGGLLVSTKIGGGNNIHNLDAYLIILLMSASYLYLGKAVPDYEQPERKNSPGFENIFIFTAVFIPVIFSLQGGRPVTLPKEKRTENALLTIQEFSDSALAEGGKVLFIAERQLLTFGEIENVPLLPEYERMDLMEMVMGSNEVYLTEFREHIENQEYALIISEPLVDRLKGREAHFGDENDVYVRAVTRPVLCYYEAVKDISRIPVQLFIPRSQEDICE